MSVAPRIDELRKRYEENPRRFFAPLANEYRKAGDLDQAIQLCQMHLAEQPGNMNGYVVYGQALYEADRMEEAKETFSTAIALDPENLIALRHLGDIARGSGDTAGARDWFRRVLDADPRNEEIIGFIAELEAAAAIEATRRTPPIPMKAVESFSSAKTVEIVPPVPPVLPPSHAYEDATPIVGFESVDPPVPAAPRSSMALLDLPADFGSPWSDEAPPPADPVSVDAAPADLASFGDVSIGDDSTAVSDDTPIFSPVEQPIELESLTFAPPDEHDAITIAFEAPTIPRAVEPESEPESEPEPEPEIDPFAEPVVAATDAPPAFVTETMATLYLQQGFTDEALAVYRQLSELHPDDDRLLSKVRELTMRVALNTGELSMRTSTPMAAITTLDSITESPEIAAPALATVGKTARAFFAAFAARGVTPASAPSAPSAPSALAALFAAAPTPADELAALAFAEAFR